MADVTEHHPEHHHIGQPGPHRGVDVVVRDGAVGAHQRREAAGKPRPGVEQRWRIHPARGGQRHCGRASRVQAFAQRG